ncbi:hypothetical protein ASE17_04950 [Phenylobacterium sp. Root77]|uniref:helix-turn-helix domain-containing protein n=1 Tax=unclassified Phenylobacterium TaxID=2640670 RepID=UPI0006F3321C|nr:MULTISPECIES: transcriptional regulator [unclassified Phenylobacterium]KQW72217.1 hypothetical protein ASC73_09175 [Phenylobacterium sp. Root1277]KQW95137.1 hypothetical protein ASC79_05320 [Phenylobacterium sp. Root1290]KRC44830.1 hypothetical protein ASE17_04950 [Phenylobacterium sp. Root77]
MSLATPLRPIRDESEFEAALREYESYFDNEPQPDTEEAYRFEVLGLLLAKYEQDHFPIAPQDPAEALAQVMDSKGKSQSDLAAVIGAPRASEVLKGKRSLSLDQIRQLRSAWGVPADVLI